MVVSRLQCCMLYFACIFIESCMSFKNDATEILYSHVDKNIQESANSSALNQARNGGRHTANSAMDRTNPHQVGCRELRSTKYISDGQCTSIQPLKELVCAGECLPLPILPNWIGGGYGLKYWSRRSSQEWRCVNDKTRTQRIQLQCEDGTTRTYKVTVLTSCKCKRYTRQHNESSHNYEGASPMKPIHSLQHHHSHHNRDKKRLIKMSKHIPS
ncbi:sclerostin domain-containing protein 1 precursor [Xenopus tropicalis]|uniref:Sclerostin domain-containing protein 1 n=1 Tax=Xenopus tropicalis TaxID=8364 RepID=A4QNH1_XENTR|eukprot:NP_001093740.1 sclerostin domain-containing protein 1 precursor [Xenopus tropicalis]